MAINTPIQSTAADITKLAMIRFDEALQTEHIDANLVLQVHDSLICECYSKDEALVSELLKRNMEEVVKLSVPLEVDIKVGTPWRKCDVFVYLRIVKAEANNHRASQYK